MADVYAYTERSTVRASRAQSASSSRGPYTARGTVYNPGEGEWPLCGATARGGKKVPHAAPFGTATRPTAQPVGSAVLVPLHYLPPPLTARDPTTTVANAPQIKFGTSHREPLEKATSLAGPGAYDVCGPLNSLSTKLKTAREGAFPTARRDADQYAPRLQTDAGPGAYDVVRATDAVKPRAAAPSFPRGPRERPAANLHFPGPRAVSFVSKHAPAAVFPRGPGHNLVAVADLATLDVPLRGAEAQRPVRHKPAARFGTAPRF